MILYILLLAVFILYWGIISLVVYIFHWKPGEYKYHRHAKTR